MPQFLADVALKTGERLTIECVLAPEPTHAAQIRPFLAHKPPNYSAHIEAAFAGQCDELETRFYVGLLNGEIVANIMTTESGGVGLFGHVYTRPDQRRKGICDVLMRYQMADFRERGGHVLLLGTGYGSPAYAIYARHGFRDWTVGRPGYMRYDTEPQALFEARFFASLDGKPMPARWKHWPLVALLATLPTSACLRSLVLPLWGVGLLEGPYCQFMYQYGARSEASARVLESETGAVTAMATCVPDDRWPGVWLLDVFAHPALPAKFLIPLIESLALPESKIQCYADPRDGQKIAALEQQGFQRMAILPVQFRKNDLWRDAWLYARE